MSGQRITKITRGATRTIVEWAEGAQFIWHHRVVIQRTNEGFFQVVSFLKRDHDRRFKQETLVSIPDEALAATLVALGTNETTTEKVEDATKRLAKVDAANTLIVEHKMPWCRARVLHVLGAAEEQGKLQEVLDELIGDSHFDNDPIEAIRDALRQTGWAKA